MAVVRQEARVALVDLVAGETGPFAGIALAQAGIFDNRPDADGICDDISGFARALQIRREHRVDAADGARRGRACVRPRSVSGGSA